MRPFGLILRVIGSWSPNETERSLDHSTFGLKGNVLDLAAVPILLYFEKPGVISGTNYYSLHRRTEHIFDTDLLTGLYPHVTRRQFLHQ